MLKYVKISIFFIICILIGFVLGFLAGKYYNSQRYIFADNSLIILDTYTGTIHKPNGEQKKINERTSSSSKKNIYVIEE